METPMGYGIPAPNQLTILQGPTGPPGPPGPPGTNGSDANWAAYTQAEYDALVSPDPSTLYVIIPA